MIDEQIDRVGLLEGMTREEAEAQIRAVLEDEDKQPIFMNDIYTVTIRDAKVDPSLPPMMHLSVKRTDRNPIDINHWRILQEIKNMIVGEQHEAVELYPCDSRVIDTANQYHLWVYAQENRPFPFGFFAPKTVTDSKSAERCGAKQRDS